MTVDARQSGDASDGACPGLEAADPRVEPALAAAGWVARFLADGARAEEVIQVYTDLGFEVMVRRLAPDHVGPECTACVVSACPLYAMIYTRRQSVDTRETRHEHDGG